MVNRDLFNDIHGTHIDDKLMVIVTSDNGQWGLANAQTHILKEGDVFQYPSMIEQDQTRIAQLKMYKDEDGDIEGQNFQQQINVSPPTYEKVVKQETQEQNQENDNQQEGEGSVAKNV